MTSILSNIFDNFGSEFLRFQQLQSSNSLTFPVSVILGQRLSDTKFDGRIIADMIDCTAQYIPIEKTLQSFLELPNVFESICTYMTNLQDGTSTVICNIIQGTLWREIQTHYKEKIVLPIFLYTDDFEIGNPLGSHAGIHKICGIYFTLGCLPPIYASLLENIFLLQLCYSSDVRSFGNRQTFQKIVSELILLEKDGLKVVIAEKNYTVYFKLVLVLGDNLGINSLLGLQESFSTNYYCRFCRCDNNTASYMLQEDETTLRNVDNYQADLNNKNFGIRDECIWHDLPDFHLTKNVAVDVMHDLWEGVCRHDIGHMLHHFIYVEKLFTLDTLNSRIQFFNFFAKNKPPTISKKHILKKYIIMSASEMSSFVQYFSLIIGDCIPENNEVWQLYIALLEIVEVVNAKMVHADEAEFLKTIIAEHHALYIKFFGNLKPKFHFLTHYPRLLVAVGPLANVSSIRFEAKHRHFKSAAHVVSSRKNVIYTIALKNQLSHCYRLLAENGFHDDTELGPENLFFLETTESMVFAKHFNFDLPNNYFAVTYVKINKIKYALNDVVTIPSLDFQPNFGIIRSIVISESKKKFFILLSLNTLLFHEHLRCFEVEETKRTMCMEWNDLNPQASTITTMHILNGKKYIKHFLLDKDRTYTNLEMAFYFDCFYFVFIGMCVVFFTNNI